MRLGLLEGLLGFLVFAHGDALEVFDALFCVSLGLLKHFVGIQLHLAERKFLLP